MGRPHPAEGTLRHHQAGARVEPVGEEEERAPQADLEEELALRAARLRPDMGGGQDLRQGQSYKIYVVGGTSLETGEQVRIAEYLDTRTGIWEEDFNFRKVIYGKV
nr:hypothetical protein BaRGS_013210 [Batillaria attramentaria]